MYDGVRIEANVSLPQLNFYLYLVCLPWPVFVTPNTMAVPIQKK